jgi:hypothetical protein
MPRIIVFVLAAFLAVPAGAVAGTRAEGDGSLSVSGASGTIVIQGDGVIYGQFDTGTLLVLDYRPDDGFSTPFVSISPFVSSVRAGRLSGTYAGTNVRFLLPSGRYTIELIAANLSASAVGRGSVVATGFGTLNDGSFDVNGGRPELIGRVPASDTFGKGP